MQKLSYTSICIITCLSFLTQMLKSAHFEIQTQYFERIKKDAYNFRYTLWLINIAHYMLLIKNKRKATGLYKRKYFWVIIWNINTTLYFNTLITDIHWASKENYHIYQSWISPLNITTESNGQAYHLFNTAVYREKEFDKLTCLISHLKHLMVLLRCQFFQELHFYTLSSCDIASSGIFFKVKTLLNNAFKFW